MFLENLNLESLDVVIAILNKLNNNLICTEQGMVERGFNLCKSAEVRYFGEVRGGGLVHLRFVNSF